MSQRTQTPMLMIFPKVLEARVPPSTQWSPSQGCTHKRQAPDQVTSWIAIESRWWTRWVNSPF